VAAFGAGAALLLGGVLFVAGALKICVPRPFQHAVHRLLPESWKGRRTIATAAAPVVGSLELFVGGGLAAAPWVTRDLFIAAAGAAALLFLGFVAVVGYAIRVGTSCGCFASFSEGQAGPTELARSLFLAALSLAVLAMAPSFTTLDEWRWSIVWWAGVCGAALVAWVVLTDRALRIVGDGR
jgi:hypothetical protein